MRLLIFLFSIIPFLSFSQQIFIPDDNFEQILIDLGYDDVLGRDVNVNSKEILLLHIYNDGSVEKNIF